MIGFGKLDLNREGELYIARSPKVTVYLVFSRFYYSGDQERLDEG